MRKFLKEMMSNGVNKKVWKVTSTVRALKQLSFFFSINNLSLYEGHAI